MSQLNYTTDSRKSIDDYENKSYDADVYSLIAEGRASLGDVLWYQSFEGFWFLSRQLPHQYESLAAELRRYMFRNVLHGEEIDSAEGKALFKTPDGETYSSLTDKRLIDRMALEMQECYRKCFKDSEFDVPNNPQRFRNVLMRGRLKRWSLIRLSFALGMTWQDFERFLSGAAFMRQLSPAVPEELVVRYCLQRGLSWSDVERLQIAANRISMSIKPGNVEPKLTREPAGLEHMDENTFIGNVLRRCCSEAANKLDDDQLQFSATAWKLICENSILRDKDYAGLTLPAGYETIWLSDTLLRYNENFSLRDYDFPTIAPSRILSRDMYCRFLSYRITMPNPANGHATKIFSMKRGELPKEIADNLFKYSDVVNLSKKRHLINRYDLLITIFYAFLMEGWRDGQMPFVAPSRKAAKSLWLQFFKRANSILTQAGYSTLSVKNPLDMLLRIALHSICPLETYTRIYELNVISALSKEGLDEKKYPSAARVRKTLDELSTSYQNLSEAGVVDGVQLKNALEFVSRAQRVLV